jgi:hypothetical protein
MSIGVILLTAFLLAIPIFIKYFLAFETKNLLDNLKECEEEVKYLSAQWRAMERERLVMRRAINQVSSQERSARTRRERLEHVQFAMSAETMGATYEPSEAVAGS